MGFGRVGLLCQVSGVSLFGGANRGRSRLTRTGEWNLLHVRRNKQPERPEPLHPKTLHVQFQCTPSLNPELKELRNSSPKNPTTPAPKYSPWNVMTIQCRSL